MNFDKVIKLCKKEKKFIVYKESQKVNFLGTEQVMYLVPDKTSCAPEYLTSLGGLSPSDVSSTKFITKDFPDKLNFTDTDADEIFTALPAIKIAEFDGKEEYVPIYTCNGVVFVKASYFKPFKNDEYEIYERTANDDITYLVIKVGMFVQALIILNYSSVDFQAVTYFEKIAAGLRKTYENETLNDTENEKGVKQ